MDFRVISDSAVSKELGVKKESWTVEDCEKYVEKNSRLPSTKRGPPLHQVLRNAYFNISEKKEPVSEEFEKHMEKLRIRQAQREYAEMVHGLQKKDTSLHMREVLDNPMDSIKNVIGMVMAAFTMGFAVYYLMKRSYPPNVAIPIGIVVFALMFIMEVILMMARFYLSEHPTPDTKITKSD